MSATEMFETTNYFNEEEEDDGYIKLIDEPCEKPTEGWTTKEINLFEGTIEQLKGTNKTIQLVWWNVKKPYLYHTTNIIENQTILSNINRDDINI